MVGTNKIGNLYKDVAKQNHRNHPVSKGNHPVTNSYEVISLFDGGSKQTNQDNHSNPD